MANKYRRSENGGETRSTLGASQMVTFRVPVALYQRIERLAANMFQPVPVVLRAAAAEYVARHRPKPGGSRELHIVWDDDAPSSGYNTSGSSTHEPGTIDANVLQTQDLAAEQEDVVQGPLKEGPVNHGNEVPHE